MKTICPHCKEEFPETPDEYLGMTLECPICQKQFVCEKPKYCSECGAVNPAKALTCAQCGHSFPINPPPPVQPPVTSPVQNYNSKDYAPHSSRKTVRISSANNLSYWDKCSMTICEIEGISTIILPPLAIIGVHGAYLFSAAQNSHKKIYWTPYRKFVMPAFCWYCGLIGIALLCLNIAGLIKGNWQVLLFGLPMSYLHIKGAFAGWNLFSTRAEEDIDYEESEEEVSTERLNVFLSLANGCGLGALLPFGGILFLLLSGIFLAIYIRKGGTDYWKAVVLCVLGIAVQAVSFYCAFFA